MNAATEVGPLPHFSGLRKCSRVEIEDRIAQEMRDLVFAAAEPAAIGESQKTQMRRAHQRLGRPKFWRVEEAWKGRAGNWSAHAVEDFRQRFAALEQRRADDAAAARTLVARLAGLRDALAAADPQYYRPQIDALEWAVSGDCPEDIA